MFLNHWHILLTLTCYQGVYKKIEKECYLLRFTVFYLLYHMNIMYFLQQHHNVGFLFQLCRYTNRGSENNFSQCI